MLGTRRVNVSFSQLIIRMNECECRNYIVFVKFNCFFFKNYLPKRWTYEYSQILSFCMPVHTCPSHPHLSHPFTYYEFLYLWKLKYTLIYTFWVSGLHHESIILPQTKFIFLFIKSGAPKPRLNFIRIISV